MSIWLRMNLPYAGISHLARFMSRIICSTRAGREYTDVKNVSMNSLTKGPSVFPGDEVAPRIESWQVIHLATRERCKRHYRAECRKGCDVIVVRDWVQKFAFTDELHPFHRWWVNERSRRSPGERSFGTWKHKVLSYPCAANECCALTQLVLVDGSVTGSTNRSG